MALRVASLLASATEIVCALGRGDALVGRSHECDHPEFVTALPALTEPKLDIRLPSADIDARVRALVAEAMSVYRVDAEALRALRPDVIVTQMQCEVCAVSARDVACALESWMGTATPAVVSLRAETLAGLWDDVRSVARALAVEDGGAALVARLQERMSDVARRAAHVRERPAVACIEWVEPLMASGNWMPELVAMAGGANVFGEVGRHSPRLAWDELAAADPDVIVVLPCGFDLARTEREGRVLAQHPAWPGLRAVRNRRVYLADGNRYFNRSGPRLVESLEILAEMLHPATFEFGHRGRGWKAMIGGE